MCGQKHEIPSCDDFTALTVSQGAEFVGQNRLCFTWLTIGHKSAKCPWTVRCGVEQCGKRHHKLLHGSGRAFHRTVDTKHVGTAATKPHGQVLHQVVPITVHYGVA